MRGVLFNNLTLAVSSWGGSYADMAWLDQDTGCTGECDNNPTLTIKNIEYTSGSGKPTMEEEAFLF